MSFEMKWGLPVVPAYRLEEYFSECGIRPWEKIGAPIPLQYYRLMHMSETDQRELRYAPKAEVIPWKNPKSGPMHGFRTIGKNWSTVFCLLPGELIPIVVEWKQGAECISLAPPSGSLEPIDAGDMRACAIREFFEETGITLANLHPLSENGIALSSGDNTQRYFPFLGYPEIPVVVGPTKLDNNELLQVILVPLADWLSLISTGRVQEEISIGITLLALQRIGRLKLT